MKSSHPFSVLISRIAAPRQSSAIFSLASVLLFVAISFVPAKAQIIVQDNLTANDLVQKLVGTGITYTNPVLSCASGGSGAYQVVSSNLGIDSGIILTSGFAKTGNGNVGANGDQQAFFAASTRSNPGDQQLSALVGINTFDRCVLEFDFVPDGDSLKFNYVFGSEEYDQFSCSNVNDVFAFFINGPGIPTPTNIALIPGTTIPVSINTTTDTNLNNPSIPSLCTQFGPGSPFAQYYKDNELGTSVTYFGLTQVLEARAAVVPCETYHMKLAIADGGDGTLDSGVFLEENSFRSTKLKLALESSLGSNFNFLVEGCTQGTITAKRTKAYPAPQKFFLTYSGSATRDVDYLSVPDSLIIPANDTIISFNINPIQDNTFEGTEYITINIINVCNGQTVETITFPVYDFLPVDILNEDTMLCQGGSITLRALADPEFSFQWSNPYAQIANPNSLVTTATVDTTSTFSLVASFATCVSDSQKYTVVVEPNPIVNILTPDTTVCLRSPMQLRVDIGPKWFVSNYTYVWVPNLYLDDPFKKEPTFFNQDFRTHRYVLSVQSPRGCTGNDTLDAIRTRPPFDLVNITPETTVKYGESIQLNVDSGEYYTWFPTGTLNNENLQDPIAKPIEPTLYTVYAWNRFGCRDTGFVKINIDFAMSEFIPTAFTPNGDGKNDVFKVFNIRYQKITEFRIFNRYGQEVYSTTNPEEGWDGRIGGIPADLGVYHYLIRTVRPDGAPQMYKGEVMLIR